MNYTQLQAALHRANIAMPLPWGMTELQPSAFCCSSCVGVALVDILDGSNYTGALWFNAQAGDTPNDVYCSWSKADGSQDVEYGAHLVTVLEQLGLVVKWNGSGNQCIRMIGVNPQDFRTWLESQQHDDDDDDDDDEWDGSEEDEWLGQEVGE